MADVPAFLCIGAQKAGTTWLDEMLREHPRIWLPPFKELQYFNDVHIKSHRKWTRTHRHQRALQGMRWHLQHATQPNFAKLKLLAHLGLPQVDDDWYREIFRYAPADAVAGEITPEYSLLGDEGVAHVLSLNPALKVILMLRDPVERAWSQIRMTIKRGQQQTPMELAKGDVLERGRYRRILARWRKHLDDRRLLILFHDEIRADPAALLKRLCGFLEIDYAATLFPDPAREVHKGIEAPMPADVYQHLAAEYRDDIGFVARNLGPWGAAWQQRHYAADAGEARARAG